MNEPISPRELERLETNWRPLLGSALAVVLLYNASAMPYNGRPMTAEFTAIIEPAPEGGYWAMCPEVAGANGQGETIEQAKESLRDAIKLILDDRREDALRGLPADAIRDKVSIG